MGSAPEVGSEQRSGADNLAAVRRMQFMCSLNYAYLVSIFIKLYTRPRILYYVSSSAYSAFTDVYVPLLLGADLRKYQSLSGMLFVVQFFKNMFLELYNLNGVM